MYKFAFISLISLGLIATVCAQCNPACGSGLSCCNQASGAQCYDPTSYSCPTGSNGPVLCGNINGHQNSVCGTQCYDPTAYTCSSNYLLCPSGYQACGQACYQPSAYGCCNNQLTSVGASCSGAPASWPTSVLVASTNYANLGCGGSIASISGVVQNECYEYGSTSTRKYNCESDGSYQFLACDQSCGNCNVEFTYSPNYCEESSSTQCSTVAQPTAGQSWKMEFSDGNCQDLLSVQVFNNGVCQTENNHASTSTTCNATTVITSSASNSYCGGASAYAQPTGVCISGGQYFSTYYGCGPLPSQ